MEKQTMMQGNASGPIGDRSKVRCRAHGRTHSHPHGRRLGAVLGGVCAALAISAVTPAQAANTVTVTNYGINAASLPWAIAQKEGFFKKEGVQTDGVMGSHGGGTSIRNLMASNLKFGQVAVSAAVGAISHGIPLLFVYGPVNNAGEISWMVKADSPMKTIKDMTGKTASYSNPRSTTEMILRMVLERSGMAGKVKTMASGGVSAGLTLLSEGAVDAAPIDEPLLLDPHKYRALFHVGDYLPNLTADVGVTTPAYAKAHPAMVRGLIRVWRDGVKYIFEHPQEAEQLYTKVFNAKMSIARQFIPQLLKSHYYSEGKINMKGLDTMLHGMKIVGVLKKPFDVSKVIDTSFLPKDLQ